MFYSNFSTKKSAVIRPKSALYLDQFITLVKTEGHYFLASRKFKIVSKKDCRHIRFRFVDLSLSKPNYTLFIDFVYYNSFAGKDMSCSISATDKNLIMHHNGYNDWFMFATKHEAKKYVHAKFVK